jgi:hypothetical protein
MRSFFTQPNSVRRLRPRAQAGWPAGADRVSGKGRSQPTRPTMNTPQRPDSSVVNGAIPLVYVGRNHDGFWVALDADTRIGGLFLFKSGALRFGHRRRHGLHGATMEIGELELPGRNRGNALVGYLASAKHAAARLLSKLAGPFDRPLAAARRALAQLACARASARIHRAAIERELYHDQYRISTKSDDDLRTVL